jgi:hypothetical protein
MNKKMCLLILAVFVLFSFNAFSQTVKRVQKPQIKQIKKPLRLKPIYKFEIQGIKRIYTSPTLVRFQVQYYISPNYPKACYIGAYVPNKANWRTGFSYRPAGRLPNGVPKGQKHFTDNITVEVHYKGTGTYTSTTLEVSIYTADKTLRLTPINWGQTWGSAQVPQQADLIISSIQVSKYNPYQKTTFTINVKNIGGSNAGQADLSVWLYKLMPNGSQPPTPNEFWSGKVPAGGGSIGPGQTVPWTHDKYEFMVEGNWRVKATINPQHTVTESNYNNNSFTYNFTLPN